MPNPAVAPGSEGLAMRAFHRLRAYFETETSHRPSPGMYAALKDMLRVLEEMANGDCDPLVHLSPLDCGAGAAWLMDFLQGSLFFAGIIRG